MMIRSTDARRRGMSLSELAYALAVISVLLGAVWMAAASLFRDMSVQSASQELQSIVQTTHMLHPNGKLSEEEGWGAYVLPPDMVGHYKGRLILYNPWKGAVSVLPGNAMAWGEDKNNAEFTVRFDGVPSNTCVDFLMQNASSAMRALGLTAVYISPQQGKGQEICFATDSFCKNTVTGLSPDLIATVCKKHNPVTVMFTYAIQ